MGRMVDPLRYPTVVAALVLLGFAAWALHLRPRHILHRALALFLFVRALMLGLVSWESAEVELASRLVPYAVIAVPFAAVNLALCFHRTYGRRDAWPGHRFATARWVLLALLVATELAYLVDHRLWIDGFVSGPLSVAIPLTTLSFAFVAYVIARESWLQASASRRSSLLLFAYAFALEPAYTAMFQTVVTLSFQVEGWLDVTNLFVRFATFGLLLLSVWSVDPSNRRTFLVVLAIPLLTGAFAAMANDGDLLTQPLMLHAVLGALWHTMLALLSTYAVLKYQLFGIELQMRRVLHGGTVTGGIAIVLFVVSELIEQNLAPDSNTILAIGVAGAVAVSMRPIMRLAHRLVETLMPEVGKEDYEQRRKRDLYLAALEGAYQDGAILPSERRVLETLRERMGLDAAAAEALEAPYRRRGSS